MSEMNTPTAPTRLRLSRRQFIKLTGVAGSGLVIGWSSACSTGGSVPTSAPTAAPSPTNAPSAAATAPGATTTVQPPTATQLAPQSAAPANPAPARTPVTLARRSTPKDVDAWLSIGADGAITLATGKVEFGQGIQTGFGQLAAEELDVPFARVNVVMGRTDRAPYDSSTVGSQSTRGTGPLVRQAAAEMHQWLLELGAAKLGVSIDQLMTMDGVVTVTGDPSKTATYAELAASKKVARQFGTQTKLKSPEKYTVVGQRIPRVDVPDKVTGAMKYGYDAMVTGMVHGKVLRPPSLGATLASVDTSAAEKMPGVVGVLNDGDFVGVAAQHVEQAQAALGAIKATWNEKLSEYTSENIHQALKSTKDKGSVVKEVGNVAQALGTVTKPVNAVIKAPYISHGQIEPMTALVHVQPDKTEVWTSTQNPFGVQDAVAQALNLPRERTIVYPLMSGGAFGRKSIADEVTVEAARLSKAFGKPVRVNWTRQEEFQMDHFRPAMLIEIAAGLNDKNELVAWQYDLYATAYFPEGATRPTQAAANAGASVLDFYRNLPNARTTFYQSVAPLPPYFWRANGGPVNALARETVIDELAELAGKDPISFRADLLKDNPRLLAVLNAAVKQAGWQPGVGVTGKGIGVAASIADGTYVAEVAQVAVDKVTGKVTVKHVDVALDCGLVVNPAAVESQVEGAIVMQGTSSTLNEAITFAKGRVTNGSFKQYAPLTFDEAPSVDITLIEDKTQPMQGVGEPAVDPTAAAISNAIYDAVGVRMRDLPFTPAKVLAAIQAKK
jgi:nicotinate dehydrogenase subunit B